MANYMDGEGLIVRIWAIDTLKAYKGDMIDSRQALKADASSTAGLPSVARTVSATFLGFRIFTFVLYHDWLEPCTGLTINDI